MSLKICLFFSLSFLTNLYATSLRVVTWNTGLGIGTPDSAEYLGTLETLQRINADVIALQEVPSGDWQPANGPLIQLQNDLALPHLYLPTSGSFDSGNRNPILSRYPLIEETSITSPSGARDITRAHAAVIVDVPETDEDPLVINLHLKCCFDSANSFRRAVELERIRLFLSERKTTMEEAVVVLGDFNNIGVSEVFRSLPTGLPNSYDLGDDISLPLRYSLDPNRYFPSIPLRRLEARQQNGSSNATFVTGSVLDHILLSSPLSNRSPESEIYRRSLDENFPGLPKSGSPLPPDTSGMESDHFPVFVDLELLTTPTFTAYPLRGVALSAVENFNNFSGRETPEGWNSSLENWQETDAGNSTTIGPRSYLGQSLGYLGENETTFEMNLSNETGQSLETLEISYLAGNWEPGATGGGGQWLVELIKNGTALLLPELTFQAGSDVRLSTRLNNLTIAPEEEFQLRFTARPMTGMSSNSSDAFINEIHYDNSGPDEGEFVEVALGPDFPDPPANLSLLLYNGSNGRFYERISLDDFQEASPTSSGHRLFHREISGIQNGAPDGIALINGSNVLQFLSYEGFFTATDGEAVGLTSIDIGQAQNASNAPGTGSLILTGTGGNATDFSWSVATGLFTPGVENPGQTFTQVSAPLTGLFLDEVTVTPLLDLNSDGIDDEDEDFDGDGQSNLLEFLAGTNANDSGDSFHPTLSPSQLSFPALLNRTYQIERSSNLLSWSPDSMIDGLDGMISVPIEQDGTEFFRVRIFRQEALTSP